MIDNLVGFCIDIPLADGTDIRDGGGRRHGQRQMTVHRGGKSQICQREQRTALTDIGTIQQLFSHQHTGTRISFLYLQ